jgi:hypothetical protein
MKSVGFTCITTLVKLFRNCIEKLGDEDEDSNNIEKNFMENPLLLEQYEA